MDPRAEERFEYEVLAVTDEIGIARWIASSHLPSHPNLTYYDGIFVVRLSPDTRDAPYVGRADPISHARVYFKLDSVRRNTPETSMASVDS